MHDCAMCTQQKVDAHVGQAPSILTSVNRDVVRDAIHLSMLRAYQCCGVQIKLTVQH